MNFSKWKNRYVGQNESDVQKFFIKESFVLTKHKERNVIMKTVNRILEKLDRIFDFLGSDTMFYIILCWFVLIFISVTYQIFIIN